MDGHDALRRRLAGARCDRCLFWEASIEPGERMGWCQRGTPVRRGHTAGPHLTAPGGARLDPGDPRDGVWPMTERGAWCGEFLPAVGPGGIEADGGCG